MAFVKSNVISSRIYLGNLSVTDCHVNQSVAERFAICKFISTDMLCHQLLNNNNSLALFSYSHHVDCPIWLWSHYSINKLMFFTVFWVEDGVVHYLWLDQSRISADVIVSMIYQINSSLFHNAIDGRSSQSWVVR